MASCCFVRLFLVSCSCRPAVLQVQTYHVSTMTASQRNALANTWLSVDKQSSRHGITSHSNSSLPARTEATEGSTAASLSCDEDAGDPLETWMLMVGASILDCPMQDSRSYRGAQTLCLWAIGWHISASRRCNNCCFVPGLCCFLQVTGQTCVCCPLTLLRCALHDFMWSQEFCERGSLERAITRRKFLDSTGKPNMVSIDMLTLKHAAHHQLLCLLCASILHTQQYVDS